MQLVGEQIPELLNLLSSYLVTVYLPNLSNQYSKFVTKSYRLQTSTKRLI
jgi:hypothetical protein